MIEDLGEHEQAVALCDELLAGNPELPRLDRGNEGEVYYLKAKAVFYLDDLEGALFLIRRAMKTAGEIPIYRAFDGQILFELARFEDARRSLETAVALDPESGHALYHLALVLERLGLDAEATRAPSRRPTRSTPSTTRCPCASTTTSSGARSSEAIDNLPRSIREYVEDVPVLVEDFPSQELLGDENVSPQILGIYIGTPRTQAEQSAQPTDVTRVILFKRNLEKICRDHDELIDQIQITVRHEIGHHLGLSEEDMERLGPGVAAALIRALARVECAHGRPPRRAARRSSAPSAAWRGPRSSSSTSATG